MSNIEDAAIHCVETFEDVQNYFSWLSERREWMAFDTETGGLEFWAQPLRLVQIGDTETAWVFRADRWLGVVEETFKKYEGKVAGQNVGFDVRFLSEQGGINVPWSNLYDTKVMAHALDPTKSTSLKALGAAHLSPKAKKLQGALHAAMTTQKWGWADIPLDFPIYWGYAGLDVILTARVAEKFWPKITEDYQQVFDLEMQISRICSDMEVRGIKLDLPYCDEKWLQIQEYTAQLEEYCVTEWGVRPSETQKVAVKLTQLGVDLAKTTASGQWSMDKDVLEGIEHPLAKAVLEHRQKTKVGSTYFKNFLEMHDKKGYIHPSINSLGARTGRMTIQNPAAQTLPRGRIVRDAFIADDGYTWCSFDYVNIEMKLLAHFCGDMKMIEAARTSDMHATMAQIAYKDISIDKNDPRRQTFKNANFAKAFVAGVEKFAWTAGMEIEEAKEFLAFYDEEFPGVKAFQKKVERVGRDREQSYGRAYVKSPIGRIHFSEKDKLYTLVNSLIQGTAADCFKQSLVDLDNSGFGEYLLLPNHDEINLQLPSESYQEMIQDVSKIMTQEQWSAPLTVSAGYGANWGEAK